MKHIYSCLSRRRFHVKLKNSLSQFLFYFTYLFFFSVSIYLFIYLFFAAFGFPQDSNISPILFSLFINDMQRYSRTHMAVYEDDTRAAFWPLN